MNNHILPTKADVTIYYEPRIAQSIDIVHSQWDAISDESFDSLDAAKNAIYDYIIDNAEDDNEAKLMLAKSYVARLIISPIHMSDKDLEEVLNRMSIES